MTTFASQVEVYRAAMPLVGAQPPTSINDQSDEAVTAKAGYEMIVRDALTSHGWSFATKRATLTLQGETGDSPAYAFQIPPDVLTPRAVLLNKVRFTDYEIRGGKLLADVDDGIMLLYNFRADESDWPGDFAKVIVWRLAAYLARGLLDRPADADRLEQSAARQVVIARARDRNAHRGPEITPDPKLVSAWRGSRLKSDTLRTAAKSGT